ncbi:3-phosphoshikimate 1-carboxyvinyltransferase [bacterium]|nr:3-phosphoshikimate 1-carboxyvinyltransferase [bacterium]
MPDSILMTPVTAPVIGSIRPPGSKSLTNRALIVAALADGETKLTGVLDSVDTRVMFESLNKLGIKAVHDASTATATVTGCTNNIPAKSAELFLENSGTSIRFLTALAATANGQFTLDGSTRMRERPIADLVKALNQVGPTISCEPGTGCPPVAIQTSGLTGGPLSVKANISSQYLSGIMMAAPAAKSTVDITIAGERVSQPYIDMTIDVMSQFGVTVDETDDGYSIQPQQYKACDYSIEPDASAASYFFATAAITGGKVTVEGLTRQALQGDVKFIDALQQMGCTITYGDDSITVEGGKLTGIDIDMNAISDTAQTLAAVAVFADGPTNIRNVAHNRFKETDRIAAVATELRQLGIKVDEHEDGMTIYPGPVKPATIETYDDHRMAMSFALIGLKADGVRIADPGCTSKTYPNFFDDLAKLCGS